MVGEGVVEAAEGDAGLLGGVADEDDAAVGPGGGSGELG